MPIYEFKGEYYHPYNKALNDSQMEVNAKYFASVMLSQGWTLEAIAGAFGNWQSESTLNTNDPQYSQYPNPRVTETGTSYGGFGLPQWTSWHNKYYWWSNNFGYNLQFTRDDNATAAIFENQLEYHDWECTYGLHGTGDKTWINNRGYNYSWEQFKKSTDDPSTLAKAYYWQYERSGANDPTTRPAQAEKWYEFLKGTGPQPPGPSPEGGINKLKGGKNVWRILHLHRI